MSNLSLGLAEMAVCDGPFKKHPHTGEDLRPLGFTKRGRAIWPILGASEDDGEDDEADEGDDEDGKSDDDDDAGGDDDDEGGSDDEDDDKKKKSDSEDEEDDALKGLKSKNRQLIGEKKAARKRAEDAERELQKLKDKDKPEVDRLKSENVELTKSVETMQSQLVDAQIENAFLRDNTYTWHNPGRALKLVDLSDVELEDGEVSGLKEALDKLAKEEPYLLKGEDDGDGKGKKKAPAKSGDQTKSGGSKKVTAAQQRKLDEAKYPGLRR